MTKFVVAVVLVAASLTYPQSSLAATNPFTVQQWHNGVWISWDRTANVKSVQVTISDEQTAGGSGRTSLHVVDEFTFVPFTFDADSAPVTKNYLISVMAVDVVLDGKTEVPMCAAFISTPRFKASMPPGATFDQKKECSSEYLYRSEIRSPASTTKIVQSPAFMLGVRPINTRVPANSRCLNCDQRYGSAVQADVYGLENPKVSQIYFFSVAMSGLPRNAAVRVDGQRKEGKKLVWNYLAGAVSSQSTAAATLSIPNYPGSTGNFRFSVWDPAKKKAVFNGKVFTMNAAINSKSRATGAELAAVDPATLGK